MKVVPVILAGGVGERFWPASRSSCPKQLLPLISEKLMIEETFERVAPLCGEGVQPIIVTSDKIAPLIDDALGENYSYEIISEPVGKNTAPAVAAAAAICLKSYGPDAVMIVVSADHSIRPISKFVSAATYGAEIALEDKTLVVFGIKPVRPDTGYGYIKLSGESGVSSDNIRSFSVDKFVEKPDEATAQTYLDSGEYLWNSGMFIWRVDTILEQFKNQMPELHTDIETLIDADCSIKAVNEFYHTCLKESIDFGIMEGATSVSAIEGVFDWDDIGSWEAIPRIHGVDLEGNTLSGTKIFSAENKNTIITNQSNHTVAVVGAEDMLVVTVGDATLVISRDKLPFIKQYLGEIKESGNFPTELF
jgi:mannose-1-phosphate guanylyltransferase